MEVEMESVYEGGINETHLVFTPLKNVSHREYSYSHVHQIRRSTERHHRADAARLRQHPEGGHRAVDEHDQTEKKHLPTAHDINQSTVHNQIRVFFGLVLT
ncbi:unnamed protein product [Nesidiocoris tenuis]|uniref:Uncharacterized protein n=1 Tax=Nesidiocoris tenuis TaxID=355587 RepID=A0A6H5G8U0_9HEMI|nr:unnamed protein product [Nesidiocoris tenuis]